MFVKKIDSINKAFLESKFSYSSLSISAANNYNPSGVMLFPNKKINSEFIRLFGDDLGRWTGQSFLGKQFHQIHFITIYRPCQNKLGIINRGKKTLYAQQEQLLRIRHGKYIEPRKAFFHNLKKLLNSLKKQSSSNDASNEITH